MPILTNPYLFIRPPELSALSSLPKFGQTTDPAHLAAALSVTRLCTLWTPDPRLDDGPALVARIRGAWGHRLAAMAASGRGEAQSARAAFFPDKACGPDPRTAAPPYRIAAATTPQGFDVTLALIGFSARWREVAFDALIHALNGPPGLALDWQGSRAACLRLIAADWTRSEGIAVPPAPNRVALDFATPLRIGPGDALGTTFGDVVVGLADRGAQISRWTGLGFVPRLSHWRDVAKSLRFESSALRPVVWDSYSSVNGRDRAAGYLGRLVIVAPDRDLMALLAAGTILGAGRSPAKGCGRYSLAPAI